jgi:hypothetical protein
MDVADACWEQDVALFVAIVHSRTVSSLLHICEVLDFKAQTHQHLQFNFLFTIRSKPGQDPPVLPENIIHVPHVRRRIAVELVMPRSPAMIVTELFVGAANDTLATFQTDALYL